MLGASTSTHGRFRTYLGHPRTGGWSAPGRAGADVVVRDLDAIYADRVRPGMSVRNINNERGPHGRSRSEGLAADLPEADSGQDGGEAGEDRPSRPAGGARSGWRASR